jgi:N-formylglutamate deformylase
VDESPDWLSVTRNDAPLLLSVPHAGTEIPAALAARLVSPWLGRQDTDWWIDRLYDFGPKLGASLVRTRLSRTVIDVNRDPSGASLYPGQATTELCPTTTFDGEPLYRSGEEPTAAEISQRSAQFHAPYHAALASEIARLRRKHARVVIYDCHSIRSRIPRLFDGELPVFNLGTNGGRSCDGALTRAVEEACGATRYSRVTNGRFKGGYITRHFGRPNEGLHAIQMELSFRGYVDEPTGKIAPQNWPPEYDAARAANARAALESVLEACLAFARGGHARIRECQK